MKLAHILVVLTTLLATQAAAQKDCLPLDPRLDALQGVEGRAADAFVGRALLVKAIHPDRDLDLVRHAQWALEVTTEVCRACERQAARVDELRATFEARGLDVLCVTGDREQPAERWMKVNRVKAALALDPRGELLDVVDPMDRCQAVLADAHGRIVWRGDVLQLKDAQVEKALEGAFATPLARWEGREDGVRQALRRGEWKKALERATKLAGGERLVGAIGGQLDAKLELFEAARRQRDWLGAQLRGDELEKALLGDERRQAVLAALEALKRDKEAQRELALQREVRAARAMQLTRTKERALAKQRMEAICEDQPGTMAAQDARVLLRRIARIETEQRGMR